MNQLAPRTFTAYIDLDNDLTVELTSLEELVEHLPQGIEYKDIRNTTDIYSDVIYYFQPSYTIRAIRITEVVDKHYFDDCLNICYLETTVEGIDVNNGEELSIPLYKAKGNFSLITDFKSIFRSYISSDILDKLESYVLDPLAYSQEVSSIENIEDFIKEAYYEGSLSRSVVIAPYCESVIEVYREYLELIFPQLIEAYDSYKNRKVNITLKGLNLDEFIFLCENFKTIGNEGEIEPFTPNIEDKRFEYLPQGPYYHLNCYINEVEGVNIDSVFCIINWDDYDETLMLKTCIEFTNVTIQTENCARQAYYSSSFNPPLLVEGNLHLLLNPNRTKEEELLLYKYPNEDKVRAPKNYPFKYIYPKN